VGEYIIRDKARNVVRELAQVLPRNKPYNYAKLRRDPKIRAVAVQAIQTPRGVAGYTDLYDTRGIIIFHPDRKAEGQNQMAFRARHPDAVALLKRSFTEDVSGYYTSRDEQGRDRKRFAVRLHVRGAPFIVGAVVNIDEFFLPTEEKIKRANQEISARTRKSLAEHARAINQQVRLDSLIAGVALCLLGGLGGLYFAAALSRPLRRLEEAVRQVGEGDFAVEVPEKGVREVVALARSFNDLGEQLTDYIEKRDFIRDTFGRYVTQEVVKRLLESKEALEMGIAVNTGAVVVGNIGSERRTKYSVVGAHVNFASRIESFALGGQVLISAATYARVKDLVQIGDVLKAEMKGIPGKSTLYEVRAIGGPYNIQLKTRPQTLVELPEPIQIHLYRMQEKVVVSSNEEVWVTHLGETGVRVAFEGDLAEWEDVRLQMLSRKGAPVPGKIYGKVTQVQPGAAGGLEATIRFTSVAPEVYRIIRRALNVAVPPEAGQGAS
jgi:HAMP domain-containing protein